jgi:MFS family permease
MWSLLTGLCGIAQQFWDLIIFRIGVGVGEAALGPIALAVLSAYFTREKLPLALGIWGAGPFLGTALATWGGAAVITNMVSIKPYLGFLSDFSDWRLTFFFFSIFGLIFALLLKFLPFPEITLEKKEEAEFMPFFKKAWKFFVLMFIGVTITGIVGYSVLLWGPEMLVRVHDIPKSIAGKNFGIFNIFFGIGGSIGAGILASKMIEKGIINAHLRVAGIFVILIWISLLLFTLSASPFYSQAGLAGMILFMSCGPGLYGAAYQNASPINLRGRTAAIDYISANVVGFALGPFALGFLNDYIFNEANGYDQTGIRFSLLSLGIFLYPIAALCFYKASKLFLPLEAEAR